MSRPTSAQPAPHSWSVHEWTERAPHVYPHTTESGSYLCRANQDELVKFGALVRVGRDRVIIGAKYDKWMQSRGFPEMDLPMNREKP